MSSDKTKMLIVRPRNCRYCGNGYYALGHAVDYARSRGWDITDLAESQAVKEYVFDSLNNENQRFFYGFGHGAPAILTGDTEQEIFRASSTELLNDRVLYFLSCLTALELGPDIIKKGGRAYAGYNIEWTWITDGGTDDDPYNDKYARSMWESANELWMAIIDGDSFKNSVQRCIDKYNAWIDYWIYENPGEEYSQEAIRWLAWDRDGLVMLLSQIVCDEEDETNCFGNDLYICKNEQWILLEENSEGCPIGLALNWALLIPVIMVVGIALMVWMGKPKT